MSLRFFQTRRTVCTSRLNCVATRRRISPRSSLFATTRVAERPSIRAKEMGPSESSVTIGAEARRSNTVSPNGMPVSAHNTSSFSYPHRTPPCCSWIWGYIKWKWSDRMWRIAFNVLLPEMEIFTERPSLRRNVTGPGGGADPGGAAPPSGRVTEGGAASGIGVASLGPSDLSLLPDAGDPCEAMTPRTGQ